MWELTAGLALQEIFYSTFGLVEIFLEEEKLQRKKSHWKRKQIRKISLIVYAFVSG